jgi:uncharacterized protein YndB with AHSA1/START domain
VERLSSETVANAALGTVEVTMAHRASAAEVWEALTDPTVVRRWFGTLTPALRLGERSRLDFGDGDFFMLEVSRLEPPQLLQYAWRFLGIGPLDTITWHINARAVGCCLTVTDSEAERSRESALLLRQGWLDFTRRLAEFLTTGEPTRYDWRREFDGSIELACGIEEARDTLFSPTMLPRWLPLDKLALGDGAYFRIADGEEPSDLRITDSTWEPENGMQFYLTHADWLRPTCCRLELSARRRDPLLTISHTGWEGISASSDEQLKQRRRLAALWVSALQCAHQLSSTVSACTPQ